MLVFWSRHMTIGGPRPETWRHLCALAAPRPVLYVMSTRHYLRRDGLRPYLTAASSWSWP